MSFLPNIHHTNKFVSAKHNILKRNKKNIFCSYTTKKSQTKHRGCKHWRIGIYIKYIWMDINFLNALFCSYVLLSETSKHPLNTTSARDTVIPSKDQEPYLNDSTMPATNQKNTSYRHHHQIPGPSQEWQLSYIYNTIKNSVLFTTKEKS